MVVSMRPYRADELPLALGVSGRYPSMHGAPVHIGDPEALGISDLANPEFGDAIDIAEDRLPVFCACGVTPEAVAMKASPPMMITHSPGHMFVTDRLNSEYEVLRRGVGGPLREPREPPRTVRTRYPAAGGARARADPNRGNLSGPGPPRMSLDGRLDALSTCDLPPGLESLLKGHDTGLGQGDLYGLQYLLLRDAEVEGNPNVALDVSLACPHHRQAKDK